jgi:hypothetical protein
MAATRSAAREPAEDDGQVCRLTAGSAAPVRSLRSGSSSALIESDEPRPAEHPERRQRRAKRKPAPADPLDGAPVVVSIRHTKPGSPLDEHLRREQIRALLDLLADHAARQEHNSKAARRC